MHNDVPVEGSADADLLGVFDAKDWAARFTQRATENPTLPLDEQAMTAWFAGAIMAGFEEHQARQSQAPTATEGRFTKLPVTISAIQFTGDNVEEVGRFAAESPDAIAIVWKNPAHQGGVVETIEGPMEFGPGWWIIRGVKNELYPCRPDVFAVSYRQEQ